MAQAVIQTSGLTKQYRQGVPAALNNLNLAVNQGEIFGYLGPNGAGKTTTIRILLDIIRPSAGSAQVLGMDARRDSVELHKRIGFLPGELNLWDSLTGHEVVNYFGKVRGGLDQGYVSRLVEQLSLDLKLKVRSYSTGNKRKLGLVLALMHRPELLILDEPTNGLDPLMQQIFNDLMREARSEGRTVFLSSHMLNEVQAICDRVGILRGGQLQAVERVTDLMHASFHWVTFEFAQPVAAQRVMGLPGVADVQANGATLKLRLTGDFDAVLRALNDTYIKHIHTQDPSLEEVFLTYYGNGSRAGNHAATTPKAEPKKEVVR